MINVNGDFMSNFSSAIKCDNQLTKDILLDELSNIICYNKNDLLLVLTKSIDEKLLKSPSDKYIVDKLMSNIDNVKIQKGIAYIIAKNNDVVNSKMNYEKNMGAILLVYNGFSPAFNELKKDPNKAVLFKEKLLSLIDVKNEKAKQMDKPDSNIEGDGKKINKKKLFIWCGIVLILVGGTLLFFYYRRKKAKMALEASSLESGLSQTKTETGDISNVHIDHSKPLETSVGEMDAALIRENEIKQQFSGL